MPKSIVHRHPVTGEVAVTLPNMGFERLPNETDDELVLRIALKDVDHDWPDGSGGFTQRPFRIVDLNDLPTASLNDPHRGAWKDDGVAVTYDVPRMRGVHLHIMMHRRDQVVADLKERVGDSLLNNNQAQAVALRARMNRLSTLEDRMVGPLRSASTAEQIKAITDPDLED